MPIAPARRTSAARAGGLLALALAGALPAAHAQTEPAAETPLSRTRAETQHEAGIDINWFFQSDRGGNPYQREGVRYQGQRAFLNLQPSEAVRLRTAVVVADLEDGGTDDSALFGFIRNAERTEPSQHQTPITANLYADVSVGEAGPTISPGFYGFHQGDYQSAGPSLDLSWELNGGDTTPFLGVQVLFDRLDLDYWDGTDRGEDRRLTVSALVGVTQTLTPRLVGSISLQFVHQQGFLGDPRNVVPLYSRFDPPQIARLLADERLPGRRDRIQLNGRLRFVLWRGWSVGVDLSAYWDSWGMLHGTVEPSVETTLVPDVLIVRAWGRLFAQRGARYYRDEPTFERLRQTRDSDLGDLAGWGVGTTIILRSPWELGRFFPELHGYVFFYQRDDLMDGFGFGAGTSVSF